MNAMTAFCGVSSSSVFGSRISVTSDIGVPLLPLGLSTPLLHRPRDLTRRIVAPRLELRHDARTGRLVPVLAELVGRIHAPHAHREADDSLQVGLAQIRGHGIEVEARRRKSS